MNLNITKPQYNKLKKGMAIQLRPDQLGKGMLFTTLRERTKKKLQSAYDKQKGIRITLEPDEMDDDDSDNDTSGMYDYDDEDDDDVDEAIGGTLFGKHGKSNRFFKKLGVKKEANKIFNVVSKEVKEIAKPAYYNAKTNLANRLNQAATRDDPGTVTTGSGFRTFEDNRPIARPHTSNTQYSVKADAPFNSGFNDKVIKGGSMNKQGHMCKHCGSIVVGGSFKPNGGSFVPNGGSIIRKRM